MKKRPSLGVGAIIFALAIIALVLGSLVVHRGQGSVAVPATPTPTPTPPMPANIPVAPSGGSMRHPATSPDADRTVMPEPKRGMKG